MSHEAVADPDALEEVWETAVKLASTHEKRRYEEVANAVAQVRRGARAPVCARAAGRARAVGHRRR